MKPELNRRQVLAFIALAAAPMPAAVKFGTWADGQPKLGLEFEALIDLRAWNELLHGGPLPADKPTPGINGDTLLLSQTGLSWAGYNVMLWASEPAGAGPEAPLDEQTRSALEKLVGASPAGTASGAVAG